MLLKILLEENRISEFEGWASRNNISGKLKEYLFNYFQNDPNASIEGEADSRFFSKKPFKTMEQMVEKAIPYYIHQGDNDAVSYLQQFYKKRPKEEETDLYGSYKVLGTRDRPPPKYYIIKQFYPVKRILVVIINKDLKSGSTFNARQDYINSKIHPKLKAVKTDSGIKILQTM